jgi:nickel-dependent lactate racemase
MNHQPDIDVRDLRGASVVIAVPDATRPIDLDRTLVPLLDALDEVGATFSVEVALGLHRPMTDAELEPLFAATRPHGCLVRQHDASRTDFAPWLRKADAIICVGVVEPHQYAGFSGGVKTVAIGCAPASTIGHMHRVELLRDPRVTLGNYADNPFQQALWEGVSDLPSLYGMYLVPDPTGAEPPVFWGPAAEAMSNAVEASRSMHFEPFDKPLDWVHLVVPPTKASNVYQASRAATYAGLVDPTAVRPGGLLIVEAPTPEGMGDGAGERACAQAMMRGAAALLAELDADVPIDNAGGSQRAYVIARTLRTHRIAFVGTECGPLEPLRAMGIPQFATAADALDWAGAGTHGAIVSQPFHRVPIARVT